MGAALSNLLLAGVRVTPDNMSNLDPGSLVGHRPLKLFRTVIRQPCLNTGNATGYKLTSLDEACEITVGIEVAEQVGQVG